MSERQKILQALMEASNGVSFGCAYSRIHTLGWDFDRAINTPPRHRAPNRTHSEKVALYKAQLAEARAKRAALRSAPKRRRYCPRTEDTSPQHVRSLRAAYCAEFIKTGVLNPDMFAQLKDYANACKRSQCDPSGVPAQHAVETIRSRDRDGSYRNGGDGAISPIGTAS